MTFLNKKLKVNDHLRYILTSIKTYQSIVDLEDVMNWCEDEGYLKSFFDNIDLIIYVIKDHNSKFYR